MCIGFENLKACFIFHEKLIMLDDFLKYCITLRVPFLLLVDIERRRGSDYIEFSRKFHFHYKIDQILCINYMLIQACTPSC